MKGVKSTGTLSRLSSPNSAISLASLGACGTDAQPTRVEMARVAMVALTMLFIWKVLELTSSHIIPTPHKCLQIRLT